MQTLRVKVKDPTTGESEMKALRVLRSWASADGGSLYLFHGTGIYGYVDGSPVKTEEELDVIGSAAQRDMAKAWWKGRGKALSEAFYAERDAAEKARAGDFQADGRTPESDLDYVMYQSRPATGKSKTWSNPFAWIDKFQTRPDWWGQAKNIAFKDTEYRMADDGAVAEEDTKQAPAKGVGAGEI
jgi:hypothetical protein